MRRLVPFLFVAPIAAGCSSERVDCIQDDDCMSARLVCKNARCVTPMGGVIVRNRDMGVVEPPPPPPLDAGRDDAGVGADATVGVDSGPPPPPNCSGPGVSFQSSDFEVDPINTTRVRVQVGIRPEWSADATSMNWLIESYDDERRWDLDLGSTSPLQVRRYPDQPLYDSGSGFSFTRLPSVSCRRESAEFTIAALEYEGDFLSEFRVSWTVVCEDSIERGCFSYVEDPPSTPLPPAPLPPLFDPAEVYILGEPFVGQSRIVVPWSTPNNWVGAVYMGSEPKIGLGSLIYWHILPNGRRYLRRMVPDTPVLDPRSGTQFFDGLATTRNDDFVPTSACANQNGHVFQFGIHADGTVAFNCFTFDPNLPRPDIEQWYFTDGSPDFYGGSTLPLLGPPGFALTRQGNIATSSSAIPLSLIPPGSFLTGRGDPNGFRVAYGDMGTGLIELYSVDLTGDVSLVSAYPPRLADHALSFGNRPTMAENGDIYYVTNRVGNTNDRIVVRRQVNGTTEVVYDQSVGPPLLFGNLSVVSQ